MGQLGLNVTFQRKSIAGRRLAGDSADRDGFPNLFVLGKNNLHTSAESKWGQRKQVTMCNTLILHVYSYRFIQIHTFVVYMCMYIYILIYILYIYTTHFLCMCQYVLIFRHAHTHKHASHVYTILRHQKGNFGCPDQRVSLSQRIAMF